MSNGLNLLVFRLKSKELIHTMPYMCRLLDRNTHDNTPKCVIAVAIASEIQGALPAKSRLGQLLEIGSRNYGFDALQSFGYLNRSAEWVSEVWQGGSLSL